MKTKKNNMQISAETRKRLQLYKIIWNMKNSDEVINKLLDYYDEQKLAKNNK